MTVGDRIKQRRYDLGMTQAELAKRCNTTYQGQTPITQTIIINHIIPPTQTIITNHPMPNRHGVLLPDDLTGSARKKRSRKPRQTILQGPYG